MQAHADYHNDSGDMPNIGYTCEELAADELYVNDIFSPTQKQITDTIKRSRKIVAFETLVYVRGK